MNSAFKASKPTDPPELVFLVKLTVKAMVNETDPDRHIPQSNPSPKEVL
jgi:hypothetical protein